MVVNAVNWWIFLIQLTYSWQYIQLKQDDLSTRTLRVSITLILLSQMILACDVAKALPLVQDTLGIRGKTCWNVDQHCVKDCKSASHDCDRAKWVVKMISDRYMRNSNCHHAPHQQMHGKACRVQTKSDGHLAKPNDLPLLQSTLPFVFSSFAIEGHPSITPTQYDFPWCHRHPTEKRTHAVWHPLECSRAVCVVTIGAQ